MRPGSHARVVIRPGDSPVMKKYIQHLRIVMLAGMDTNLLNLLPQLAGDRGARDKLDAGAGNRDKLFRKSP